jgi:GGDEF domain-containing protein
VRNGDREPDKITGCRDFDLLSGAQLTASFGVYEAKPETDSLAMILKRSDTNLYPAQRTGRNCVIGSEANQPEAPVSPPQEKIKSTRDA